MKKLDPIERALDAYSELDTDQKLIFGAALRHIERAIARMDRSVDYCAPYDETKPKRGRPPGSKNRKIALTEPASPLSPEGFDATALFASNGAPTEGL